jgi:hypothetical protein
MKPLALLFALSLSVAAATPEIEGGKKVKKVIGKCQGGDRPSISCKTCKHCAYCGIDKGRGVNSATCAVCAPFKR